MILDPLFFLWRACPVFSPDLHRNYGIHYNDPNQIAASEYRVGLCISVQHALGSSWQGLIINNDELFPSCSWLTLYSETCIFCLGSTIS